MFGFFKNKEEREEGRNSRMANRKGFGGNSRSPLPSPAGIGEMCTCEREKRKRRPGRERRTGLALFNRKS